MFMTNLFLIDYNKFRQQIQVVLDMNGIFRDKIDDFSLAVPQTNFIQEEINEIETRGIELQDPVEFVDGLADTFVTTVFLEYLLCGNVNSFNDEYQNQYQKYQSLIQQGEHIKNKQQFLTYLNETKMLCTPEMVEKKKSGKIILNLLLMFHYVNALTQSKFVELQQDIESFKNKDNLMDWAIDEVNDSNMSKFPSVESKTDAQIQADLDKIKKKVGHDNVGYVVKNNFITYLDKNKGKFQKPTTFKEPDLQAAVHFKDELSVFWK